MSKIHVFYHGADLDGHCCGAIVKYRFPEAIMHPINYGDEFPWDEIDQEDTVFMVDFCLQPEHNMERLAEQLHLTGHFYWIDHHSSAIEAMQKLGCNPFGVRNTKKAACELTWEYLFPDKPVPLSVKLLSLYDSWTYQGHELELMVLPFQMRMRMEILDPKQLGAIDNWYGLFTADQLMWMEGDREVWGKTCWALIEEGKLLLRYDEEQKRRYMQTYGFETVLDWVRKGEAELLLSRYKAITLNLGHTNSKVFDSVWKRRCNYCSFGEVNTLDGGTASCSVCNGTGYLEPYDLMITFCRRSDRKWNVSLYSTKPDIDCGAIAKSFGGGGHRQASGFQCDELPFQY